MNKNLFLCLLLFSFEVLVLGLVCWECEDAHGQEDCLRRGRAVQCRPNQDQCHLTVRQGGWGEYPWIEKTCKTTEACAENYVQNVHSAWAYKGEQVQCNEHYPSSVCRCCCGTDLCNQNRTSCLLSDIKRTCNRLFIPRRGSMKCSDRYNLRSVCEFKCDRGYALLGQPLLTCSHLGEWDHAQPRCPPIQCLPRMKRPKFGRKRCTNGIKLGSRCRFSCQKGYRLTTPPVLQCIDDEDGDRRGVWSYPQPECIPKQCPMQAPLENGRISCTKKNYFGSECTFACNTSDNYFMYPDTPNDMLRLNCLADETWDKPRPICERRNCSLQGPIRHGMVTCTKRNDVGSKCTFSCNSAEGYFLNPNQSSASTLTCLKNETWDKREPCCTRECPKFIAMDMVIVLDSSASIGKKNWDKTVKFVATFVRQFTVGNDSTHFAVIRFNSEVDEENEIRFGDYPDSSEYVAKEIEKLPYEGMGFFNDSYSSLYHRGSSFTSIIVQNNNCAECTNTGNALGYANAILLSQSNRDRAPDVVLLFTDGNADDEYKRQAEAVRKRALIYVIPIREEGAINPEQLQEIAGRDERVLRDGLDRGFDALNDNFIKKITERLCATPCFNPLHDHPNDASFQRLLEKQRTLLDKTSFE